MSEMPLPPAVRLLGSSGIATSSLAWVMRGLTAAGLDAAGAARLVKGVRDAATTVLDTTDI